MAPYEPVLNPSKSENFYARCILDPIQNTTCQFGMHEAKIVKMILSQSIVINKLSIETKPEFDSDGRVMYVPNVSGKPYLITDSHRDSPIGFGVKISATKKTYIIQRRVSGEGRSRSEGKSPSQVIRATGFDPIHQCFDRRRLVVVPGQQGCMCRSKTTSYFKRGEVSGDLWGQSILTSAQTVLICNKAVTWIYWCLMPVAFGALCQSTGGLIPSLTKI